MLNYLWAKLFCKIFERLRGDLKFSLAYESVIVSFGSNIRVTECPSSADRSSYICFFRYATQPDRRRRPDWCNCVTDSSSKVNDRLSRGTVAVALITYIHMYVCACAYVEEGRVLRDDAWPSHRIFSHTRAHLLASAPVQFVAAAASEWHWQGQCHFDFCRLWPDKLLLADSIGG